MKNTEKDVAKALNRAYFFLRFRPRTKSEIERYLQKKSEKFYHWTPDIIPLAIVRLEELGFVDDIKFVASYIATRNTFKPKGQRAIAQELTRLGVEKDNIDTYFADNPPPEEDLAYKALQDHWGRFIRLDKRKRFEKAAAFLMRRGFSFTTAKKVIEQFEQKNTSPFGHSS